MVVVIVRTARRLRSTGWAVALGLVLGGALGNLIDRIFRAPGFLRRATSWTSSRCSRPTASLPGVQRGRLGDRLRRRCLGACSRCCGIDFDGSRARTAPADAAEPPQPDPSQWAVTSRRLHRTLPVPDGLDGQRVDAGAGPAARAVAAPRPPTDRRRRRGRRRPGRAARATGSTAGSWLEVELPAAAGRPGRAPQAVEGLTVLYDDDDIVVVDKPVGVAAHPSPGWTGPTVIGGLAAAGLPGRHVRRGRAAGHRAPAGRRHHRA